MKNKKSIKPSKPLMLNLPFEKIEVKHRQFIRNHESFSLEEIFNNFKESLPLNYPLKLSEIKFNMCCYVDYNESIDSDSEFYFDPETPLFIDNPKYKEELAAYNRDLKKYNEALKSYKEQKAAYDNWLKQQEIETAQAILKKHKIA